MKRITSLLLFTCLLTLGSHAQTKHLWCTTTTGGAFGLGTILEGNADGTNFHTVFNFNYNDGSYPEGKMIQGHDGKLYCTTYLGGYDDSCCICRFDPATDSVTVLYEFMYDQPHGWDSYSGMILGSDGNMYGMTTAGGASSAGVIYRLDPVTGTYTDIFDFNDSTTGGMPNTELLQGRDGKLYGTANYGGSAGTGLVFRFDPATSTFNVLHNFGPGRNNNGIYANLMQASNGLIYGTTAGDGTGNSGTIFSIDPSSGAFTSLYSLAADSGYVQNPSNGLVQGANGKLYGATAAGGAVHLGMIYSFDISTNTFTPLASLDQANIGYSCQRALSVLSSGAILGTAFFGGPGSNGSIFSVDPASGSVSILLSLDGQQLGSNPSCEVFESTDVPNAVKNILASHLLAGPNPASASVNVQNLIPGTPVIVSDQNGQEILHASSTGSSMSINVSGLAPGTYFINGEKFVKE